MMSQSTLWQFFDGSSGPPQKKKKTNEERLEQGREYEKERRERGWKTTWLVDDKGLRRNWLQYDEEKNEMFCSCCRSYARGSERSGPFVVGTDRLKLDGIKTHEGALSHEQCIRVEAAKKIPSQDSVAGKTYRSMHEARFDRLDTLFQNAHAIAKKGRPFTDYEWQCDLDQKKGLDIGKTYRNRKQATTFTEYIAQDQRNIAKADIKPVKFMSILSDGSTDSAVIEEEIVYVRYANRGKIKVQFVAIEGVEKANAQNIAAAITRGIERGLGMKGEDWRKKLVGMATDGASVMMGCNSGVVVRLTEGLPYVIVVHCMAHRLELSFKDATKENSCHKQLETLLMGLYYFYKKSPLNRSNLKASYVALDKTVLLPTRVGGTRWVAHLQLALDHFLRGYPAIVQHLEQVQSPDATGVRDVQRNKAKYFFRSSLSLSVVKYACFLSDVLVHLSNLSRVLQKQQLSLAQVHSFITSTKAVLIKYKTKAGPMLRRFESPGNPDVTTFEGRNLSGPDASFVSSRQKLIDNLMKCLDRRLGDVSEGVLLATSIVDLKTWPDKQNMCDFGEAAVDILVDHFRPVLSEAGCDPDKIADEWTKLKSVVYSPCNWEDNLKKANWEELNCLYRDVCPNALLLVDLLLTLPASTADAERGFNRMKLIKNDWRSRLRNSVLNDLMLIMLESPEIEDYQPRKAVELWFHDGERERRTDYMDDSSDDDDL